MRCRLAVVFACLVAGGCGPYPRDVEGTYDHVVARQVVRIGLGTLRPEDAATADEFAARVAAASHAKAIIERDLPLEVLIGHLDAGDLDLVIDDVALDSPWVAEVAVIEPLAIRREGGRAIGLSPIAANGENRWIALLEREVRDIGERR